jgi:hypothetical protein
MLQSFQAISRVSGDLKKYRVGDLLNYGFWLNTDTADSPRSS